MTIASETVVCPAGHAFCEGDCYPDEGYHSGPPARVAAEQHKKHMGWVAASISTVAYAEESDPPMVAVLVGDPDDYFNAVDLRLSADQARTLSAQLAAAANADTMPRERTSTLLSGGDIR